MSRLPVQLKLEKGDRMVVGEREIPIMRRLSNGGYQVFPLYSGEAVIITGRDRVGNEEVYTLRFLTDRQELAGISWLPCDVVHARFCAEREFVQA